jgi:hypothetical protein
VKAKKYLTNPKFLIALALLLVAVLSAVGLWKGPLLGLAAVTAILAAVVLWPLIEILLEFVVSQWASGRLLKGLGGQQTFVPSKETTEAELAKKFQEGIRTLKTTLGRDFLYKLPWFLLIGESGCGKTTLLRRSSIRWPLGGERQGIGGTVSCDWWFANEAIILDTAGRFAVHEEKSPVIPVWRDFLKLIRRSRPRKPIDGVIVALPADSLIAPRSKREAAIKEARAKGKLLHQKLTELQRALRIVFPVHVLVTKCDRIRGFDETFNLLPAALQGTVLGWSNSDAGNFKAPDVESIYAGLERDLGRIRRDLLRARETPGNATMQYLFPEELAETKSVLAAFLSALFEPDSYVEPHYFRGVYFSSSGQDQKARSALIDVLGESPAPKEAPAPAPPAEALRGTMFLNLAAAAPAEPKLDGLLGKSYFVDDFCLRKVFGEIGYVRPSRLAMQRSDRLRLIANAAAAALAVAVTGYLVFDFVRRHSDYQAVASSLEKVGELINDNKMKFLEGQPFRRYRDKDDYNVLAGAYKVLHGKRERLKERHRQLADEAADGAFWREVAEVVRGHTKAVNGDDYAAAGAAYSFAGLKGALSAPSLAAFVKELQDYCLKRSEFRSALAGSETKVSALRDFLQPDGAYVAVPALVAEGLKDFREVTIQGRDEKGNDVTRLTTNFEHTLVPFDTPGRMADVGDDLRRALESEDAAIQRRLKEAFKNARTGASLLSHDDFGRYRRLLEAAQGFQRAYAALKAGDVSDRVQKSQHALAGVMGLKALSDAFGAANQAFEDFVKAQAGLKDDDPKKAITVSDAIHFLIRAELPENGEIRKAIEYLENIHTHCADLSKALAVDAASIREQLLQEAIAEATRSLSSNHVALDAATKRLVLDKVPDAHRQALVTLLPLAESAGPQLADCREPRDADEWPRLLAMSSSKSWETIHHRLREGAAALAALPAVETVENAEEKIFFSKLRTGAAEFVKSAAARELKTLLEPGEAAPEEPNPPDRLAGLVKFYAVEREKSLKALFDEMQGSHCVAFFEDLQQKARAKAESELRTLTAALQRAFLPSSRLPELPSTHAFVDDVLERKQPLVELLYGKGQNAGSVFTAGMKEIQDFVNKAPGPAGLLEVLQSPLPGIAAFKELKALWDKRAGAAADASDSPFKVFQDDVNAFAGALAGEGRLPRLAEMQKRISDLGAAKGRPTADWIGRQREVLRQALEREMRWALAVGLRDSIGGALASFRALASERENGVLLFPFSSDPSAKGVEVEPILKFIDNHAAWMDAFAKQAGEAGEAGGFFDAASPENRAATPAPQLKQLFGRLRQAKEFFREPKRTFTVFFRADKGDASVPPGLTKLNFFQLSGPGKEKGFSFQICDWTSYDAQNRDYRSLPEKPAYEPAALAGTIDLFFGVEKDFAGSVDFRTNDITRGRDLMRFAKSVEKCGIFERKAARLSFACNDAWHLLRFISAFQVGSWKGRYPDVAGGHTLKLPIVVGADQVDLLVVLSFWIAGAPAEAPSFPAAYEAFGEAEKAFQAWTNSVFPKPSAP